MAPRVDERRPRRDFDPARQFGMVQSHADLPALGAQFIEQVAAHFALDGHRVYGKAFVAPLGAYGKRRELFAANFFPRGVADWTKQFILRRAPRGDAPVNRAPDPG